MSSTQKTSVLERISEIAAEFGLAESSVCGKALKDSRKLRRLQKRDEHDAELLRRLDEFADTFRAERKAAAQRKAARSRDCTSDAA